MRAPERLYTNIQQSRLLIKVQASCEEKGLISPFGVSVYVELKKTMLVSWKMAFSPSNLHISKIVTKWNKNGNICNVVDM